MNYIISFRPLSGMRCLNRLKNEKEVMELLGLKFPSPLGDEVLKPIWNSIFNKQYMKNPFPSPLGDEVLKPYP